MKKIIALITSFVILSCSSDDDQKQLPLTMNGSNSVEYTFNGKRMSSFDSDEDAKEIMCNVSKANTWIYFKLGKNNEYSTLSLSSSTGFEEGKTYSIKGNLNSNVKASNEFYGPNIPYVSCSTNNEIGGTIKIEKLDYTNRIIAAKFSYDCADDRGNVYAVRDGWFDLKF
ncbi:hypothetical protein SAMN05421741_10765 [Paenimyroides ummariense]|uniref:Lipoprotein n=1 Tax=Paenimyroides ummariense TaxID=913024 RepID=A0A1I5A1E8_9FLAO|nr:hypothetical protein [Paenimyroides ummariense]SFN56331.1 hypothetical protein SAMN05421741_10765 [Paenimyroides ummariense]